MADHAWFAAERPVELAQDALFHDPIDFLGKLKFLADHVASATDPESGQAGAVFGISAPWGSGKSSALRMMLDLIVENLDERIRGLGRQGNNLMLADDCILSTSTFYANVHEAGGQSARLGLAYEIMQGYPAEYRSSLLADLGYSSPETGYSSPIHAEIFLRKKLGEYASSGPVVEQWIMDTFVEHRKVVREEARGSDVEYSHVHVEFIDDLDRCSEEFTAQVLAALNFWSTVPNLFFVVAADEEHLRRSAANLADLDERYTGEALEKFVHFQLRIPPLIGGYADAARFALRLLPEDERLNAGLRHFKTLLEDVRVDRPFGLLAPALSARTPRQAKRILNELLQAFTLLKDLQGDSVKRIIARMVWPAEFDEHIHPVLIDGGSAVSASTHTRSDWLRLLIQSAVEAVELHSGNVGSAAARLRELAKLRGLDIGSCPAELLLYLGAEPQLEVPDPVLASRTLSLQASPTHPFGATERSQDNGAQGNASMVDDLITTAQIASARHDFRTLRALSVQLIRAAGDGFLKQKHSPAVGNLALDISTDTPEDVEIGWQLHQLAHQLDPDRPNIRLNLANFLLDLDLKDYVDVIDGHLDWCERNHPDFKTLRRKVLKARATALRGDEIADLDALVEEAAGETSIRAAIWLLVQKIEAVEYFERVFKPWFEESYLNGDFERAALVLQNYAESLLSVSKDGWRESGADVLRYVICKGFMAPDRDSRAIDVGNLAIFLNNNDYEEAASVVYRLAYEISPRVAALRSSYSRYLVNVDDPENALAVQQGQEVSIPLPDKNAVRAAFEGVPDRFSDADPWWQISAPVELVEPIPEIGP